MLLASAVRVDESEVVVAFGAVVLEPIVATLPVLLSLDLHKPRALSTAP